MSPVRREDFELESGLADDFDATIVSASFGFDERYAAAMSGGNPDPLLILTLEGPKLESPQTPKFATGAAKQWQATADGKEVISGKDPNSHRFNENSRSGQLVARLIDLAGKGDKAKGQEFFIARGFLMTQAGFFEGLTCHWKREKKTTVTGEERDVLLPNAMLEGVVGSAVKPSGINPDWVGAIVGIASGKTDRELRLALLKDPATKDNNDLKQAVFNKNLLGDLVKEGFLTLGPDGKYV